MFIWTEGWVWEHRTSGASLFVFLNCICLIFRWRECIPECWCPLYSRLSIISKFSETILPILHQSRHNGLWCRAFLWRSLFKRLLQRHFPFPFGLKGNASSFGQCVSGFMIKHNHIITDPYDVKSSWRKIREWQWQISVTRRSCPPTDPTSFSDRWQEVQMENTLARTCSMTWHGRYHS